MMGKEQCCLFKQLLVTALAFLDTIVVVISTFVLWALSLHVAMKEALRLACSARSNPFPKSFHTMQNEEASDIVSLFLKLGRIYNETGTIWPQLPRYTHSLQNRPQHFLLRQ
jgi:hypothetical protein